MKKSSFTFFLLCAFLTTNLFADKTLFFLTHIWPAIKDKTYTCKKYNKEEIIPTMTLHNPFDAPAVTFKSLLGINIFQNIDTDSLTVDEGAVTFETFWQDLPGEVDIPQKLRVDLSFDYEYQLTGFKIDQRGKLPPFNIWSEKMNCDKDIIVNQAK